MNDSALHTTRRYFLGQCTGVSVGAMALNSMAQQDRVGLPSLPHFAPKAKRVIFLTQSGGPSQLELFDHKPGLMKWAGKELPESVRQGQRLNFVMPGRMSCFWFAVMVVSRWP